MKAQPHARSSSLLWGITGRLALLDRVVKTGLCALFAAGMLTGTLALPASAQPDQNPAAATESAGNTESVGNAATASQLAEMLTSPVAEERVEALQQVTEFAYHRPEVDLSPTVPVLVDIYKDDPAKESRLAAASALYAIGAEEGMKQVRQHFPQEPSLRVQYVSVSALLDHYGPRAFAGDAEAAALAQNVLVRKGEAGRLAQKQRASAVVAEQQ